MAKKSEGNYSSYALNEKIYFSGIPPIVWFPLAPKMTLIMDGQFMATMTRLALNLVMFTCLARPTIAHFCMYSALYCNSSTLPPSFEFVGCCFFK